MTEPVIEQIILDGNQKITNEKEFQDAIDFAKEKGPAYMLDQFKVKDALEKSQQDEDAYEESAKMRVDTDHE